MEHSSDALRGTLGGIKGVRTEKGRGNFLALFYNAVGFIERVGTRNLGDVKRFNAKHT